MTVRKVAGCYLSIYLYLVTSGLGAHSCYCKYRKNNRTTYLWLCT